MTEWYPGKNGVVTWHDDGKIQKRCAGNESNATDKWIGFLCDLPQQIGEVQTEADSSDASRTCNDAKDETHAAHQASHDDDDLTAQT